MRQALAELAEARQAPYYDQASDAQTQAAYYADVDLDADAEQLFEALSELVTGTPHTRPRYKPHVQLYPAVDLQPNGQLRSIYTGEEFPAEAFILEDARVEQQRLQALAQPAGGRGGPDRAGPPGA